MRLALARRRFLVGLAAAASLSPFSLGATRVPGILDMAMRRMGGRAALSRVRRLSWEGDAIVHAGGRDIAIGVATEVAPFDWARSRTWLASEGPTHSRTLVITRNSGWVERDGRRELLAAAQVAHERAQYAIYGLMLLAPLAAHPEALQFPPRLTTRPMLDTNLPPAPPTHLFFEADGRLAEARNQVPDPAGGTAIAQHFIFSADTMPGPIAWPRRLTIEQNGAPFFELTLSGFEAS